VADAVIARVVLLHGQELSYLDVGHGPAVLFIHGLLGSQRHWTHLVEGLSFDQRVVIPDLYGHGGSARPTGDYSLGAHAATLRDLLDSLDIDRVTLVGHSLGGGIAMQFWYLFPERVERLVLVSSGGLGRDVSLLLRSAVLPGSEWVLPIIASNWVCGRLEAVGRLLARVGWRSRPEMVEVWRGFASLGDGETRRAFLATTRSVIDPGGQSVSALNHLATSGNIPTLIVWGARDRIIPASHAATVSQLIDGSRIELFERAGHFPHLDEPGRFAQLLREFIASSTGA
jgi:pimeloyl-ACP methyl ester carboxylesterase